MIPENRNSPADFPVVFPTILNDDGNDGLEQQSVRARPDSNVHVGHGRGFA